MYLIFLEKKIWKKKKYYKIIMFPSFIFIITNTSWLKSFCAKN